MDYQICDKCDCYAQFIYGDMKLCIVHFKDVMISQLTFHRDLVRREFIELQIEFERMLSQYTESVVENFKLKVKTIDPQVKVKRVSKKKIMSTLDEMSDTNKQFFTKAIKTVEAKKKP